MAVLGLFPQEYNVKSNEVCPPKTSPGFCLFLNLALLTLALSTNLSLAAENVTTSATVTAPLVRKPATYPDAALAGGWAQLIVKPGLENCFKVSETLYRGAQPTREGFEELRKMGVKTVINLRSNHSDAKWLPEGMREIRIPMTVWKADTRQILQFLDTATDPRNQPVFVHCQEGVDRTGLMCVVYRSVTGGWGKDQAVEEMKQIGAHDILVNLKNYMKKLDIEALRRRLLNTPLEERSAERPAQ